MSPFKKIQIKSVKGVKNVNSYFYCISTVSMISKFATFFLLKIAKGVGGYYGQTVE